MDNLENMSYVEMFDMGLISLGELQYYLIKSNQQHDLLAGAYSIIVYTLEDFNAINRDEFNRGLQRIIYYL